MEDRKPEKEERNRPSAILDLLGGERKNRISSGTAAASHPSVEWTWRCKKKNLQLRRFGLLSMSLSVDTTGSSS